MMKLVCAGMTLLGLLVLSALPVSIDQGREPALQEKLLGRFPETPFDMVVLTAMTTGSIPDLDTGTMPTGWMSIGLEGGEIEARIREAFLAGNQLEGIKEECLRGSVEGQIARLRKVVSGFGFTLDQIGTSEEELQELIERGRFAEYEYWTELAYQYSELADLHPQDSYAYLQGIWSCLIKAEESITGSIYEHRGGMWKPAWW